jgi:hypothetical protein
MSQTNWDKALTYTINLNRFREEVGEERVQEMILELLKAGGTFAVSQGRLNLSDFSMLAFRQKANDWLVEDEKVNHFEILTLNTGEPAFDHTFPTYLEALNALTSNPLISSDPNPRIRLDQLLRDRPLWW